MLYAYWTPILSMTVFNMWEDSVDVALMPSYYWNLHAAAIDNVLW